MKEAVIYSLVALSSLTMLAYTVHMFIGGLVSEETEFLITVGVVITAAVGIALLARDVIMRRKTHSSRLRSGDPS